MAEKMPDDETAYLEYIVLLHLYEVLRPLNILGIGKRTHEEPLQTPPLAGPVITSQYTPSGRDVKNVFVQEKSSLLITAYPVDPVLALRNFFKGSAQRLQQHP